MSFDREQNLLTVERENGEQLTYDPRRLHGVTVYRKQNGSSPDTVDKLRKMLAFLDDMQDPEELGSLPTGKVHTLTGDRKGTWSLSVTRNRRLTFCIDRAEREIYDVNLEDYH